MIYSWNLLVDDLSTIAEKFDLIGYKNLKKGTLDQELTTRNALTLHNLLKAVLSKDSITLIKRNLRRISGISIPPEKVVGEIRRLLNESAIAELENIKISLGGTKRKKITVSKN
jgi:hypothetical protein